ncbi:MAG: hypothetical protein NTX56_08255 [Proteobacteria bacterium]|nr:hypothetical protein [Pseudomonadota bacterium]
MKFLVAVALGCLSVLPAAPAMAQQEDARGGDFVQGRRHGRAHGGMHQLAPGQAEARISRSGPEARPAGESPLAQQLADPRSGAEPGQVLGRERLSPEERRQMRRDINAAGRDIYRNQRSE